MRRLNILLHNVLDDDEAHAGAADCLTDCLCIVGIIFVALDVRLDELRRD